MVEEAGIPERKNVILKQFDYYQVNNGKKLVYIYLRNKYLPRYFIATYNYRYVSTSKYTYRVGKELANNRIEILQKILQ